MKTRSVIDTAVEHVKSNQDYKAIIAREAHVDPGDVDRLIDESDPRVEDAILSRAGISRPQPLAGTSTKYMVETFLSAAVGDKRFYWCFGPPGCGKTYCTTEIIKAFDEPVAVLRASQSCKRGIREFYADVYQTLSSIYEVGDRSLKTNLQAHAYSKIIRSLHRNTPGVLVVDEAQVLSVPHYEFIREIFDETDLSIVMIGSTAFEDLNSVQKMSPQSRWQFLRRINSVYWMKPANGPDVKAVLDSYSIPQFKDIDYERIVGLIKDKGDIDTLCKAIGVVANGFDSDQTSWKKVGADIIVDAIESLRRPVTIEEIRKPSTICK